MTELQKAIRVSGPINAAGLTMTLETGKLAPQADGAVLVRVGDTVILSTVVTSKPREGIDFFPLTVDVEERMYAAGKIPGGVFRREGRPGEPAILTCRLTDRPLRPSFPEGFRNEVQVVATVMGADLVNPHDVASINGASAALTVSGIPFDGPIGAVRLSRQGSEWIAHPTFEESLESTFELVVAGRMIEGGDIAIMMVEAGGTEATWRLYEEGAPKVDEEVIAGGLEEAKQWIAASIELQKELRAAVILQHGPIAEIPYEIHRDYDDDVFEQVAELATANTSEAMSIADKTTRNDRLDEILEGLILAMSGTPEEPMPFAPRAKQIKPAFRSLQKKVVRSRIVNEGLRIDGRGTADIRPLSAEVEILPTAHGSALFQRGETQVLSVLTLGMPRMEQFIGLDELRGTTKRYIHHYNFPPYSTGETGPGGLAQASRDRSRRARRAGAGAGRAVEGGMALRAAHRLRRAQLERLHLDGVGVWLHALADGRRRADQGARRRHRDGPRVRRRQVHDPHRHPRHRGRVRRHGLQGRRHPRSSSPRCSSTPRSTGSPPTCWPRRSCRPVTPA